MPKFTSPLDGVRVAAPCPVDWGTMVGDERVRFCGSCNLHVYNLSGMTKREAESLVTNNEGRLCVRFYRRPDGTILTRNCPVGLSAVRRRASRVAGSVLSAVLGFFAGLGLNFGLDRALSPSVMEESAVPAPPMPPLSEVAFPAEVETLQGYVSDITIPSAQWQIVGGMMVREHASESDAGAPRVRGKARRRR